MEGNKTDKPKIPSSRQRKSGSQSLVKQLTRSACDNCHAKRIKCVLNESAEGGSPRGCVKCASQGILCHFSLKEKTGPKPKSPWDEPLLKKQVESLIQGPGKQQSVDRVAPDKCPPEVSKYIDDDSDFSRRASLALSQLADIASLLSPAKPSPRPPEERAPMSGELSEGGPQKKRKLTAELPGDMQPAAEVCESSSPAHVYAI